MPPFLDVSDVLLDPELADTFTVTRRQETISTHGRVTITAPQVFNRVIGVVTSASPNDLERLDDNQRMGRHISIITRFRLIGPAVDALQGGFRFQPDTITWRGDTFVVKQIDPYPQYGFGFVQALAGSMDSLDQPTP